MHAGKSKVKSQNYFFNNSMKWVALVQGVRPFSVKISGLVCVVSYLILLSTTTARYSVIIWPSLWFTVGQTALTTDHRPYRKHWQEISELKMPEGLCMDLGLIWTWKLFASIDPHHHDHDAVLLKLYWGLSLWCNLLRLNINL